MYRLRCRNSTTHFHHPQQHHYAIQAALATANALMSLLSAVIIYYWLQVIMLYVCPLNCIHIMCHAQKTKLQKVLHKLFVHWPKYHVDVHHTWFRSFPSGYLMSTVINSLRCFFIPIIKTALDGWPFSSSHATAAAAAAILAYTATLLQTHQKQIHNVSFTGCFMTLYMDEI